MYDEINDNYLMFQSQNTPAEPASDKESLPEQVTLLIDFNCKTRHNIFLRTHVNVY